MNISPALSAICRRRCGFDPANLSPAQIRERLPRIFSALEAERQETVSGLQVVQKSAHREMKFGEVILPSLIRDESLSEIASPDSTGDPNEVFESVMPLANFPE